MTLPHHVTLDAIIIFSTSTLGCIIYIIIIIIQPQGNGNSTSVTVIGILKNAAGLPPVHASMRKLVNHPYALYILGGSLCAERLCRYLLEKV